MITKCYLIENNAMLDSVVDAIENNFPCFTVKKLIKCDFSELTIQARVEDIASIERMIAPVV